MEGRGILIERVGGGGLINFPPLKTGGGLVREGELIEDLRHYLKGQNLSKF